MSTFNKNDWIEKTSEYMEYISQHKKNIEFAWCQLRQAITGISLLNRPVIMEQMQDRIRYHDDSKMTEEEFLPYRQHFYPIDGEVVDDANFQRAWELHYNRNDHHWQHWINVDGSFRPCYCMEDKICAYLEMICDWQAMSYVKGGSAYSYYKENKDMIRVDPNWIPFVEEVLGCLEDYCESKVACTDG